MRTPLSLCAWVLAPWSLVACGGEDPPASQPSTASPSPAPNDPIAPMPEPVASPKEDPTLYPDLTIEVLAEGEGEPLAWDADGHFHYTGVLLNGVQFDSSFLRGEPFPLNLATGGVIKGWKLGLQDMKLGEKRRLTIPPELGYGKFGSGANIPGDATLVFTVERVAAPDR